VLKLKDDTFTGHIIQNRLFESIFKVFESQKTRNNLINSALLELFEFLRHENLKKLISHVVDNYLSTFEGVQYVDTFRLLGIKNDQNKELQNGFSTTVTE
jgi:protein phosphatase-4 regulatory subunit 3